jgi:Raf kinase inhibitor-like YbhB/YbcL family protein
MRRPYVRVIMTWVVLCVIFVGGLIALGTLAYKNTHWSDVTAVPAGTLSLTSPAFENNGTMPAAYTADGADVSPPLQWQGAPDGTQTFALIVEDRDSSSGAFTHWLIADIPGTATGLPEGVPKKDQVATPLPAAQGLNSFRDVGYGGPKPPPGKVHHYYFYLYALDGRLDMPGEFSKSQLRAAMAGHTLAEATLVGCYQSAK